MITSAEYALIAGTSYISTRAEDNRFPVPQGWTRIVIPDSYFRDPISGFEVIAFQRGTEIVISYAGTDPKSYADLATDSALAAGNWADQLLQAAEYYLQIKAANSEATITLTGHSLGGGLAALVAVFFGVQATTFDQAPFALSALAFGNNNAADLRARLAAKLDANGVRLYDDAALSGLTEYLRLRSDSTVSNFIPRSGLVDTIRVQGEFLEGGVLGSSSFGNPAELLEHGPATWAGSGFDLHSQALLAAFLQSRQSAATSINPLQTLGEVTKKLTSVLEMFFDKKLFASDPAEAEPNLLEHLVRHEAGVQGSFVADAMVTRFTADLWKLAQDGGLTMTDNNPSNAELNFVSKTLVAFAMQMYYEDTANATSANKRLFTDVTGGIRFDMADVSAKFAIAFQNNDKLTLSDAKGFDLYFKNYLQQENVLTAEERGLIQSMLPYMRDWYVQAGASGLATTDILNRGAFMLGGNGSDTLVGGSAADLLVSNAGDDTLDGGAGIDTLLGGIGADTLIGGEGHDLLLGGAGNDTYYFEGNIGLDIIRDSDGTGKIVVGAPGFEPLSGGKKLADNIYISDDKQFTYTLMEGSLVIRPAAATGASGVLTIKGWSSGQFGITLQDIPATTVTATTSFIGDFVKRKNEAGDRYLLGADGNYVANGSQPNALDLITGTSGQDRIQGLGGDDALLGRDGADLIEGGEGNDVLMGGLGADTLKGGSGGDLIYGSSNGLLDYWLTIHDDPIVPPDPVILGVGFSWWRTSPGPDGDGFQRGFLSSTVGRDQQAGDQANIIEGGSGNDVIYAGTGDDVVDGGDDQDDIVGMGGADVLFGGAGRDRIYGDGPSISTGVSAVYTPPEKHGQDILFGGDGNDLLFGQGSDDVLYGGEGDDFLYGDDRDDANTPRAVHGMDYLDGGAGNDFLFGGDKDDILIGGKDNDYLIGGEGKDVYMVGRGDGKDVIVDNKAEGNVLRFAAGIGADNVTLRLGSLMLDLGNGDEVHIEGFDPDDAAGSSVIDSFEFADGTTLGVADLLARGFDIDGTEGDDASLMGTSVTDRMRGFGGNDLIASFAGDDVLGGDSTGPAGSDHGKDYLDGGAEGRSILNSWQLAERSQSCRLSANHATWSMSA